MGNEFFNRPVNKGMARTSFARKKYAKIDFFLRFFCKDVASEASDEFGRSGSFAIRSRFGGGGGDRECAGDA